MMLFLFGSASAATTEIDPFAAPPKNSEPSTIHSAEREHEDKLQEQFVDPPAADKTEAAAGSTESENTDEDGTESSATTDSGEETTINGQEQDEDPDSENDNTHNDSSDTEADAAAEESKTVGGEEVSTDFSPIGLFPVDSLSQEAKKWLSGNKHIHRDHSGKHHGPYQKGVRSIDGMGNNPDYDHWGSLDLPLVRYTKAYYTDGKSVPYLEERPSARHISNLISSQQGSILNSKNLTDMFWQWGQFIDHDISITEADPSEEKMPIPVPVGDPYFDPYGTGTALIDFSRSEYDVDSGYSTDYPRQQMNAVTAFIDGSMIYGSYQVRADALRTFEGGKLKTSENHLLPYNELGFPNAGGEGPELFFAGDVRANEQVALLAMHTLFVREHNWLAERIGKKYPHLTDEQIYQFARKIVGGEIQVVTYNEFLPLLLGKPLEEYTGYDKKVNPSITNLFSTAAFRFGHSLISPQILRLDNNGSQISDGHLSLREAFFRPDLIKQYEDVGYIIKGLASQQMQELDTKVIDDLRNFLFGPPGAGGFDLVALNIQRGRDHGLPFYNDVRELFGREPIKDFSEITSDPQLEQKLIEAFGSVDQIDAWTGLLAEDHEPGALVGKTLQRIIADQFYRLRDGDRYWYQRTFRGKNLKLIEKTKLSDIIRRNTQISNIQEDVFLMP